MSVKPAHYVPSTVEHHCEALLYHLENDDCRPLKNPLRWLFFESDAGSDRNFEFTRVRRAYCLLLETLNLHALVVCKPEPRGSKKNPVLQPFQTQFFSLHTQVERLWAVINSALTGPELLSLNDIHDLQQHHREPAAADRAAAMLATERAALRCQNKTFSGEQIRVRTWPECDTSSLFFSEELSSVTQGEDGVVRLLERARSLVTRISGQEAVEQISATRLQILTNEGHLFADQHFLVIARCSDHSCCTPVPKDDPLFRRGPLLQTLRIALQPFPSADRTRYLHENEVRLEDAFLQTFQPSELLAPSVQLAAFLAEVPAPTEAEFEALADRCCFADSEDFQVHRDRLEFLQYAQQQAGVTARERALKLQKEELRVADPLQWTKAEVRDAMAKVGLKPGPRANRSELLLTYLRSR